MARGTVIKTVAEGHHTLPSTITGATERDSQQASNLEEPGLNMKLIRTPDHMFDTDGLAERWGVSRGHLQNLRAQGKGPAYVKLFGGSCRYRLTDVEAFEAAHVVATIDQAVPA